MKKIYSIFSLILLATFASAQVNITLQVDVSEYAASNTIDANGIHVAGSFLSNSFVEITEDWAPGNSGGTLTEISTNLWSVDLSTTGAEGDSLQFKFINGNDWSVGGPNIEGQSGTTALSDACGKGDGFGGYNRLLVLPATDLGLQFCWDQCTRCDGSDPVLTGISNITYLNSASVSPNPVMNVTSFSYTLTSAQNVSLNVYDMMGNMVASVLNNQAQASGFNAVTFDASDLVAGNYIYRFEVGGKVSSGTFIKQ